MRDEEHNYPTGAAESGSTSSYQFIGFCRFRAHSPFDECDGLGKVRLIPSTAGGGRQVIEDGGIM